MMPDFFFLKKELDLEIKALDMESEQLWKINILKKTTNSITPLRLRMRTRAIFAQELALELSGPTVQGLEESACLQDDSTEG